MNDQLYPRDRESCWAEEAAQRWLQGKEDGEIITEK